MFLTVVLYGLAAWQVPGFQELARRAEAALDSRPAEAAGLYRQALKLRPDWPEGWLYLGAALYQVDRYAEATHAFRKGIALNPNTGTAWAFLGLAEAELDNGEQALADIRKGLELGIGGNPEFELAVRVKAAQIHIRASEFDAAMPHLHALSLRGVDSRAVVETMGLAALGSASSLSELSPERRAVVSAAGKAAWALANQKPAAAVAAYRELMEKYPGELGVHYAHGLYLMETELERALAEFQAEARKNPKHWPSLILIGSLQIKNGAVELAAESLRQALAIAPASQRWICRAELGRASMTADRLDEAIVEFETAVRLMPSNAQLRFLLAQAYRRAGRRDDAARESTEFQRLKTGEDPLGVPGLRPLAPTTGSAR
jgi:tetratricopeptide (TPR) repeat protein